MLEIMGKRIVLLVMDGVGVGALPDAAEYGDEGSNTLGNLSRVCMLHLPCLEMMGLGNLGDFGTLKKMTEPAGSYGTMLELSKGKDTVTGHWEMMGIVNEQPFPTYPHGFPPEIMEEFERRTGRKGLGNRPASGTEILRELGEEHMQTGRPIVYTSADSVFQIAAHNDIIPLRELYRICRVTREILIPPHHVCRVIARPFTGTPGNFTRTPWRRDFTIPPPEKTVLDHLAEKKIEVVSVGKVMDIFAGRGFSRGLTSTSNSDAMAKVAGLMESLHEGLIFSTLTDFDTLYGHRNNPEGLAKALEDFDHEVSALMEKLRDDDFLIITADHGCDPTTHGTDHSREYVPVLLYARSHQPRDLGLRTGFFDIGATVAQIFGIGEFRRGRSLL
jgi:phosphopentomutase